MGDGKLREVSLDELQPGMVLRLVGSNGEVAPFSDYVVTYVFSSKSHHVESTFNVIRPYAYEHLGGELHSVERMDGLSERSLGLFRLVLLDSGKPYMMTLTK